MAEKINDSHECLCRSYSSDDTAARDVLIKKCAALGCNICLSRSLNDDILYPKHYNTGKIQPIDAIESWNLDFRLANVIKYVARAGKKDPAKTKEDLEKAIWYIQRFINNELN